MLGSVLSSLGTYKYVTLLEPNWLDIEQVTVPIKGFPASMEGFRIVQLTDIHHDPGTQIDRVKRAVAEANDLRPDLIVLTGDYVTAGADSIFELNPVLSNLNAKHGVFSILGNHDLWTNASIVRAGLEEVGIPVLKNSGISLSVGRDMIFLAGLDDGWSGQPDLNRALQNLSPGIPTILLMHEPDFADITLAKKAGIDLQLSGHTHGGQVRIPGLGAIILPDYGKKYEQGLYRVKDMWLYTNRGLGVISPPVRFNCRPEITEITLVADNM